MWWISRQLAFMGYGENDIVPVYAVADGFDVADCLEVDETVGTQAIEGLAQRGGANAIGFFQRSDAKLFARGKLRVNDVFAKLPIGLVRKCLSFQLPLPRIDRPRD